MISRRRLVRLHEEGFTAHDIANTHDIPTAMVWRELMLHYEGKYLAGAATVASAERRIAQAETSARQAWTEAIRAEGEARVVQAVRQRPSEQWMDRLGEIAREPSRARRVELASVPPDQEVPPQVVIDLRTKKEA